MTSATVEKLDRVAKDLRKKLREVERIARGPRDEKEYDRERKARQRSLTRDLTIPDVKDWDRRSACEANDCLWLQTYIPSVFTFPFTTDQRLMIEEIGHCLEFGLTKCFAAPRHDGKTSIARYLALKYALQRSEPGTLDAPPKVPLSLVINATGPKASKSLSAIKQKLRGLPGTPLVDDYPLECVVARYVAPAPAKCNNVTANGGRTIRVEWGAEHIILPEWEDSGFLGGALAAMGITSNEIQGYNLYDVRPRFCILDDLDDRDSLASKDGGSMAGKIETNIDENVAGLGGPGKPLGLVMLCTIPSIHSVAFKYSDPKEKASWSGVRLQKIKKWPDSKVLWDEYIHLRQKGKQTFDDTGRPVDKHGREAHQFLLDHYDEMHEGAEVSNSNDYIRDKLPDGSQSQVSTLQNCYDYIADKGLQSFMTEYQNDPPEDENIDRLILTAYHIQHNCLSGTEKRIVPEGTSCIVRGADVQKLGLHWVAVAFNDKGAGVIIDYDFHEFMTQGRKAADCELLIYDGLLDWWTMQETMPFLAADGTEWHADATLIDMGWKEESWNTQPVQLMAAEVGHDRCLPTKGKSPYSQPQASKHVVLGENWHITHPDGLDWPIVMMNSDHWKLKVHEGFLSEPGEPGALTLFDPPQIDGRVSRSAHLSFSKHILSESWETRFVPGFKGQRTGWWKSPKPNHYFDAAYQTFVGRSMQGISVIEVPSSQPGVGPERQVVVDAPAVPVVSLGGGRERW